MFQIKLDYDEIVRLFHEGLRPPEIAKRVGCSNASVYFILKKRDIAVPYYRPFRKYDPVEVIRLYCDEKLSVAQITNIVGGTTSGIMWVLKRHGIKRRSSKGARALYIEKHPVSGPNSVHWKGGRIRDAKGYIRIYCPEHPYATFGYVAEHRLVVEKRLGRFLLPGEIVHHIDGIKDHNDDSNLELWSPANHKLKDNFCRNCPLKREIRLLRWQIRELQGSVQLRLDELQESRNNPLHVLKDNLLDVKDGVN